MQARLFAGVALAFAALTTHAATDYPSGYTKCVQATGATCTMTGTRSTALGKSGEFVYATKTGSFACTTSAYPSSSFTTSAWCSYASTTTSSSSASSVASSVASSSSSSSKSSSSVAPSSSSSSSKSSSSSVTPSSSSSSSSSSQSSSSSSAASSNDGACVSTCTDYIRKNTETKPLTQSRIDSEAGSLKSAFTTYLSNSNSARSSDKATLKAERSGLSSVPSARGSDKTGPDTMPLSETASYYASSNALAIAREIVSFQVPSGLWGKNMVRTGTKRAKGQSYIGSNIDPSGSGSTDWNYVGTFDNAALTTEIRYLAKVQTAQSTDRSTFQASIIKGLNAILAAQYPSYGWPQNYPVSGSAYHDAVTLNDDVMLNIIKLLREIGTSSNSDFAFVDSTLRNKAASAAGNGITWLLSNQVRINGQLTIWGQQHDVFTLKPTPARAYEMAALSSAESGKIVKFLMTLPNPDATMRTAVYAAADFFKATQIDGKAWVSGVLTSDSSKNSWARFYDLSVYNPTASTLSARGRMLFGDFADRHGASSSVYGLIFGSTTAVSAERLTGYAQYNVVAQTLLSSFPTWAASNPKP
ncbi:MAG: pectate lyase [Rhodocyclaceae bacterium]